MTQPGLNFDQTRADQIEKAWREFHAANPKVWVYFQKFAFEVINAGRTRYSADAILHRIRWHVEIEIVTDEVVRINNNFSSLYARLFIHSYPEHGDFFMRRKRISEDKPAYDVDIQVHDGGPAGNEAGLDHRLTEIAFSNTREFHRP